MTPEEEVESLRTYKALCKERVAHTKAAHERAVKEYNRVRHMLANRVAKLRKEKAK